MMLAEFGIVFAVGRAAIQRVKDTDQSFELITAASPNTKNARIIWTMLSKQRINQAIANAVNEKGLRPIAENLLMRRVPATE